MGLSVPAVGIHGTPDPASIGYSVSHGCIRMRIPEAEWLFNQVDVGTPGKARKAVEAQAWDRAGRLVAMCRTNVR